MNDLSIPSKGDEASKVERVAHPLSIPPGEASKVEISKAAVDAQVVNFIETEAETGHPVTPAVEVTLH